MSNDPGAWNDPTVLAAVHSVTNTPEPGDAWSDPAVRAAVQQTIDETPEGWCDASHEEHDWTPGDPDCRRCGADLAAWNDEDED